MTLEEIVLQNLTDWQPAGSGRQTHVIAGPSSAWSVQLTTDRQDALSCALWEVLQARRLAEGETAVDVGAWAARLATRGNGWAGPLAVVEVDAQRRQALVRSKEPRVKGKHLLYFEVMLSAAGQATVRRYQGSRARGRRKQIAFVLTHDAVARLAADLADE
jgi:hypothetical protein